MKYIVKFFVITFFVFYFTHTFAEEKIVFINMDLLLNESKAGKSAQKQLEKHHKSNLEYLMKIQNRLKEEEKDILSKKNILKQEEFEAKISKLREDAKEYQNSRVKLTNELTQKRTEVTKKITTYCQERGLQKESDKRIILPDKALAKLLRITKDDNLTYFNLQKYMMVHFPNKEGIYPTL